MKLDLKTLAATTQLAIPLGRYLYARARQKKLPLAVTLSLTNRCNFRCVYCHVPSLPHAEMDTQAWCKAIDELAAAGMIRASVMGGEPLLRQDCGQIIEHLKRRHVHAAMNTNGWLVEDRIEDVAKLDVMCVSLDGPESVHDVQRCPGSYKRVVRAIELATARGVQVVTMTVLTPKSLGSLDFVLQMARDMGFRPHFQLEHDADCDADRPIAQHIDDDAVRGLAQTLLQRKNEGWPVGPSRAYLRELAAHGRRLHGCDTCLAGRYFCNVMPDGTVVPCLLTYQQRGAVSGRAIGYAEALRRLPQPLGSGCSCESPQELNMLLSFQTEVFFNAIGLTTGLRR